MSTPEIDPALNPAFIARRDSIRDRLLEIDERIAALLAERFVVTGEMGVLKAEFGVPAFQPTQHESVVRRWRGLMNNTGNYGLADVAGTIARVLVDASVVQQEGLGAPKVHTPRPDSVY